MSHRLPTAELYYMFLLATCYVAAKNTVDISKPKLQLLQLLLELKMSETGDSMFASMLRVFNE